MYGVAALLGSSQLHGICPGDFCDFSMANLNPLAGSMAAPSVNTKKLSQFRRKLSMMVVAESFADADEVDLDGGGDDAGADGGKKKKRGKRGPRSTSRTRAQDVAAELHKAALAGIAVNLDSDPSNPEKLISFRSILQVRRALLHSPHRTTPFLTSSVLMCRGLACVVWCCQARQEMPLVRTQLARHSSGGKGDYVTDENIGLMDAVASVRCHLHHRPRHPPPSPTGCPTHTAPEQ